MAESAKKLPLGRLYANGRGFVPNIRQSLYSDLVVALGLEPQAALSKNGDKDSLPAARGLPRSWDEIGPGHLVIAQEALDYGWWEAIVLDRQGDTFILQYRDYPHLPKFVRHRSGIALMSPPTDEAKPAAQSRAGLTASGPGRGPKPLLPLKNLEVRHGQQDCAHPRAER